MRLDKFITEITGMTRKEAKSAISRGLVLVNMASVSDPALHVDEKRDTVYLSGSPLSYRRHTHIMMNKPGGVLTATEDRSCPTVIDLLPEDIARHGLTPVGRLDKDTTGLLILTTDGQLAHRLISPRHHVDKEYIARIEGVLDESDIAAFAQGITLSDFTALPARLFIDAPDIARVILTEGKYHQVRRMLGSRGKPVIELRRVRMGEIILDACLKPGEWRELSYGEIAALYASAGLKNDDGERS